MKALYPHIKKEVLIPLKSGQARNTRSFPCCATPTGLNPFEIRAGQKHSRVREYEADDCLNPFEIRAGQKRNHGAGRPARLRLNPFEIRAGQKPARPDRAGSGRRLNPFEIRAGQKLKTWKQVLRLASVLIPLKSGQARNRDDAITGKRRGS